MDESIQQYAEKIASSWKPLTDQQRRLLANHFNAQSMATAGGVVGK